MLYKIIVVAVRAFMYVVFGARVSGKENMPAEGGIILASNHASNWDPVVAGAFSPRQLTFMAKAELFSPKPFGALLKWLGAFPVKRGRGDIGAIKSALTILKENRVVLLFPEGTRNHDTVAHAKSGVAMLALKAGVPVVPMYISGHCRPLGRLRVTIGKPMDFSLCGEKADSETLQVLSDTVLAEIRKLKTGEPVH